MSAPTVDSFFHAPTSTFTYLLTDQKTSRAAIIDPVLDYDAPSGRTSTESADRLIEIVRDRGLGVDWILETHAHADHVTAAQYLCSELGGRVGVGEGICKVQKTFARLFNFEAGFRADGSQFDHLFCDGEQVRFGETEGRVLATPGHTSDSVTYIFGDAAFIGDTLFMPDSGTARCDFPGGDAQSLYQSIGTLYSLPDHTRLFTAHDYQPGGREPLCEATVADQKARNIHLKSKTTSAEFVELRATRDATLAVPKLLIPAIQINIRAGELPPPEDNKTRYLKVPIDII